MITYEDRQEAIEGFARSRKANILGLAYYRPDPNALPTHCIQNVSNKVDQDGGAAKYGWTFHHRVNPDFGDYLFATHHAVWHNPNGTLIDITPFHKEKKHQPITSDGDVLFLLDESATPIEVGNLRLPLPLIYFPIKANSKILDYIKKLTEQEINDYRVNFAVDVRSVYDQHQYNS